MLKSEEHLNEILETYSKNFEIESVKNLLIKYSDYSYRLIDYWIHFWAEQGDIKIKNIEMVHRIN